MTYKSNLHTHTPYCDGRDTAEKVVLRAIELGFESLGFSSHSNTPIDIDCCMSESGEKEYRAEIISLRDKYNDKIEIYLGVEQDAISKKPDFKYDYMIGSTHYLPHCGELLSVDNTATIAENVVREHFDGDWIRYAEAYYEYTKDTARITGCDIVGHFDLLTKFNEGSRYFDENNLRYRAAAIDALRYEIGYCDLFEINTGAIYRKKRSRPYPADFILKEIKRLDGQIVISSDSHDAESLGFMFDEAEEYAKSCGFKYAKILKNGKFEDVKL